jgi:phosphoglycerol transferase MdoB-like AlkP superfamily enzyme
MNDKTFGFACGLLAPLALGVLGLRLVRMASNAALSGPLSWLDALGSDVSLLLCFTLVGVAALKTTRGKAQVAALLALQLVAVPWVIVELVAHNFWNVTGSTLDYQLILFSLERAEETWALVNESTPTAIKAGMAIGLLVLAALPWGLAALWRRRGAGADTGDAAAEATAPEPTTKARQIGVVVAALTLGTLGVVFPFGADDQLFGRSSALNILIDAVTFREVNALDALDTDATPEPPKNTFELTPREGATPRDVIFIVLESTRYTATTLGNPDLATTPYLAELAKDSLTTTDLRAIVPHTSKALVSILCGTPPNPVPPITEAKYGALPVSCAGGLFRQAGYATAFIQSAKSTFESRPSLVRNMGYADFIGPEDFDTSGFSKVNYFGVEDNVLLEPSRAWIREVPQDQRLQLTYLTLTPHHNYLTPRRYGIKKFDTDREFNRYLNSVRYLDFFVKNVIEMLKEEGRYENSVIVITGDHGEGFREHGRSQHDNVIYEEGLRVPLLIHAPGLTDGGAVVTRESRQTDILPTATELAGFDLPDDPYDGHPLTDPDAPKRPIYSHCWYDKRCMSVVRDGFKYIHHFGTRPDEAFQIDLDPTEVSDLIAEVEDPSVHIDELKAWRAALLDRYVDFYNGLIASSISDTPFDYAHNDGGLIGAGVVMRGWEVEPAAPRPGERVRVSIGYQVFKTPPAKWKAKLGLWFGGTLEHLEHVPVYGLVPYDKWEPGLFIRDTFELEVPRDATAFTLHVSAPEDTGGGSVTIDVPIDAGTD